MAFSCSLFFLFVLGIHFVEVYFKEYENSILPVKGWIPKYLQVEKRELINIYNLLID
jgi:hypothetical protein